MIDHQYRYYNEVNGVLVTFGANRKVKAMEKLPSENDFMGVSYMRQASIKLSVDGVLYDFDTEATLLPVGVVPGR